jgi:hypothetical protein
MEDQKLEAILNLFKELDTNEVTLSFNLWEMVEIITALKMRARFLKRKNATEKYQRFIKQLIKSLDSNLPL